MRLLLAAAPHRDTFGYSMPPPGLLRLGGDLERAGVDVRLEDLAYELAAGILPDDDGLADAACDRLLARGEVDVVGISVMGATLPVALAILERVRARAPRVHTWLGGPGTTGVDRTVLERFACVDVIVRGEGEITTRELVAAFDSARRNGADAGPEHHGSIAAGVAGTTWRRADGVVVREADRAPIEDLTTLAPYARHLLPSIADYKRITGAADGLVPIDSGRGCVYDCSFCTIGRFWSRRSRTLPAKRLVEEVLALRELPGARTAYLCHDLFGANRGQAIAFCDEMIARGSPVPFEVRARADHLDRELLERMAHAGGYRVLIGVESADERVRERNHKGMRRGTDMLRVVEDCAAAGVTPILSLILGLPGEDDEALEASLDLCARAALRAGVNLSLHLVNPQPGCGLGEEFGDRARPIEGIPPDMAFGTGETAAERALVRAHPDLFSTFALLPDDEGRLRRLHAVATTLPDLLMRYPRTFAWMRRRADGGVRGALELYDEWRTYGRSFEAFVAARGDAVAQEMAAWERALVRMAARGDASPPTRGPRADAELIDVRHDLPRLAQDLRDDPRATPVERAGTLAVVRRPGTGPMAGVATLRVGRDVGTLLATLDGRHTLEELDAWTPGLGDAVRRLIDNGLVATGPAEPPRPPPRTREGLTTT